MSATEQERVKVATARSAVASLGWNYAGSVVTVVFQLAYTAYTGRAVAPDSFGAYAIALTTVQFLGYFANAGLSTCLLRARELTLPTVRAASYLGAASGAVCFLLVESAASVCGALWRMPELTPMLRLLGCQFLLLPGSAVAVATLRRIGHARSAVAAELGGQSVGMAGGAALLACGWSPWGLVAAQPVAVAVTLVIGAIAVACRQLPAGPPVRARDLLASSGFLTGYSLAQFATNNAPVWATARLLGPGAAGVFSRASLLTGLPVTFLAQGLSRAATPLLAERHGRGLPLGRTVEQALCTASAAALVGFGALAGIGPAALTVLLGPGWGAAAALVPVLSLAAACGLLCSTGTSVDQALHVPRALVVTQLAVVAATAAAIAAAAAAQSLGLMAGAAAAGQAAGHVVQVRRWHQARLLRAGAAIRIHLVHAAIGAALGGAALLGTGLGRSPAGALACGLACMLPVLAACLMLRTRLPLYEAAVAAGLLRPRKPRPGAERPAGAAGPGDPAGHGPQASAPSAP